MNRLNPMPRGVRMKARRLLGNCLITRWEGGKVSKERLGAFMDAVIAIVMTILVLELEKPAKPTLEAFWDLRINFAAYALSFLWLAQLPAVLQIRCLSSPFSSSSQTGLMLLRYSTTLGTTSMIWSICSMVFYSPMESLRLPCATSCGRPMESRTWLGSSDPEVQALPEEAQIP